MEPVDGLTRRSCFSLEGVSPAKRFEIWRESIACIFDVERTAGPATDSVFNASLETRAMGPLMMAHTRSSALEWRRSPLTVARDGLDHYMIQFYARGTQACAWSGGEVEMPDGGFLIYDLSREMEAVSTDMANISLVLPRALLAGLLRQPDDQYMRAVPGHHPLAALLRSHLEVLWRRPDSLNARQVQRFSDSTAHLVAACLDGSAADPEQRDRAVATARLAFIRRDIESRLCDPALNAEDLCRRHGLSRTSLYRLFERMGGVRSYIRERRLTGALRMLLDVGMPERSVSGVGRAFGFSDAADFSRAFQQRYGLSPRAARHYGRAPTAPWTQSGLDRRYERWLHTLAA